MKKLSLFLAIIMVLSTLIVSVSAAVHYEVIVEAEAETTTYDGVLGENEYDDAYAINVKRDEQRLYYINVGSASNGYLMGSDKPDGDSKIYVKTDKDGVTLFFDIADGSISSNIVKTQGGGAKYGFAQGDTVSVIFSEDNGALGASSNAKRISFCPFVDDNGTRTIKLLVLETWNDDFGSNYTDITESIENVGITADTAGYKVEAQIPWSVLDTINAPGAKEFKVGEKLHLNFEINDGIGWALFTIPVNSRFLTDDDTITDGFHVLDRGAGNKWVSLAAGGYEITMKEPVALQTYQTTEAAAPTVDGVIEEGEYAGAALYEFGTDDLTYYSHNTAGTSFWNDTPYAGDRQARIGDSKIYIAWTEDGLYVAADIADTTVAECAVYTDWYSQLEWGWELVAPGNAGLSGDYVTIMFRNGSDPIDGNVTEGINNTLSLSAIPFPKNDGIPYGYRSGTVAPALYESFMNKGVISDASIKAKGDNNGYQIEYYVSFETLGKILGNDAAFTGMDQFAPDGKLNFTVMLNDGAGWGNFFATTSSTFDAAPEGGFADQADKQNFADLFGTYRTVKRYTSEINTIEFAQGAKVSFEANNGTTIRPFNVAPGTTLDLSEYTTLRPGSTFLGWCTDEELTNIVTEIEVTDDITLFAKWETKVNYHFGLKAAAPKSDGIISEGEYDDGFTINFNGADLIYYDNTAARDWFGLTPATMIDELRHSNIIGESSISVVATDKGLSFAFDVADPTPGANTVRDVKWSNGLFIGDAVHVTIKDSPAATTQETFDNGDAIRFSVAPFKDDWSKLRTVNFLSAVTNDLIPENNKIIETTYELSENCVADANGYVVEFTVPWSKLETYGFKGATSYEVGEKLYFEFQITDAMGINKDGVTDWGVFQLVVNGSLTYSEYAVRDDYPVLYPVLLDNRYSFNTFGENEGDALYLGEEYSDVKEGEYYTESVYWAVENGITNGVDETHFAPDLVCTRAEAVTFLWRAAGCPEPSITTSSFVDVDTDSYYGKAALWAVENGITNGVDETHFAPDLVCTRAEAVTLMYRAAGEPSVEGINNPFVDVEQGWYSNAVLWAIKNGITTGTDATHFSPNEKCQRGQILTLLYRAR